MGICFNQRPCKEMITLSGKTEAEIKIEFTGLRKEKIAEKLNLATKK